MNEETKIFTITSAKGGTGKSIFAVNLAATYAKMGYHVLLVEIDFYSSNIAYLLNLHYENDIYNLEQDIVNNKFKDMKNYITTYKENFDVMVAPKDPRDAHKLNGSYLNSVVEKLKKSYQIILFDTNHIIDDINLLTFDLTTTLLYLINNTSVDLKNMKSMVSIFNDMERENYKIILYEAKEKASGYFSKTEMKNIIGAHIDYEIGNDFFVKNLESYILNGKVMLYEDSFRKKHSSVVKKFELLAKSLLKEKK